MTNSHDGSFEFYKLYLATAEKVSDRRNSTNVWMLSVNSAVVSLYGYLANGKASVEDPGREVWQWAIPIAGVLISIAWLTLLRSYGQLNTAKFQVLQEIEKSFQLQPLTDEWTKLQELRRSAFHKLESYIPTSFALLYIALIVANFAGPL